MFDIAWTELLVIGAVALIFIKPKDLPKTMRAVGEAVGKLRRMASEFQSQFHEAMRESELQELKKQVEDVGGTVKSATATDFNPIQTIREEFKSATNGAKPATTAPPPVTDADIPPPLDLPPPNVPAPEPQAIAPVTVDAATVEPVTVEPLAVEPAAEPEAAPAKPPRKRKAATAKGGEAP